MQATEFWEVLLYGVVIGLMLGMLMRWIGKKLFRGRIGQKRGSTKNKDAGNSDFEAR